MDQKKEDQVWKTTTLGRQENEVLQQLSSLEYKRKKLQNQLWLKTKIKRPNQLITNDNFDIWFPLWIDNNNTYAKDLHTDSIHNDDRISS